MRGITNSKSIHSLKTRSCSQMWRNSPMSHRVLSGITQSSFFRRCSCNWATLSQFGNRPEMPDMTTWSSPKSCGLLSGILANRCVCALARKVGQRVAIQVPSALLRGIEKLWIGAPIHRRVTKSLFRDVDLQEAKVSQWEKRDWIIEAYFFRSMSAWGRQ